jgi:hypothetical protein
MSEVRRTVAAAVLVTAILVAFFAIDPGFFCKDDFQLQYLPGSRDVMRAFGEGSFPLLSPYSWMCAALGGEYQFGVFSIFRMLLEALCWLLPLSLTARGAFLFIAHAAVAAAGGYRLARSYDVSVPHAMVVAIVAALNGWILWWGTTWYPGVASFAWLPWYWLALRGILRGGRWSWAGAAFSLYLLIAAGWPYSLLMATAIAVMCFGVAVANRQWRAALTIVASSLLGALLAAPAVLMLLEYYGATVRAPATGAFDVLWTLPMGAIFGLLAPTFITKWEVFAGTEPHAAVELVGAVVPILALAGAWKRSFVRRHAAELLLAAVLLVLMFLPAPGPFRWSFRWLPLFHLLIAVVGATALDSREKRWRAIFALLALNTLAVALFDSNRFSTLAHLALVALLCVAWWLMSRRGSRLAPAIPAAIAIVSIVATFVAFSARREVPRWSYGAELLSSAPFDSSRRYLAMYGYDSVTASDASGRISVGTNIALRPGNVPMLAGLHFLNGYSPLGLAAVKNLLHMEGHGPLEAEWAERLVQTESAPQQLLHHLGVDGIVVPLEMTRRNRDHLAQSGWRPHARVGDSIVLHRLTPSPEPFFEAAFSYKRPREREVYREIFVRPTPNLPVVLLTPGQYSSERYGRRRLTGVASSRDRMSFVVRGPGPKALIVFRRPWMPGWRATIDGRPLPVLRAHMIMPAIEIPADAEGEVRLIYRPASLVTGLSLAAVALLVIAAVSLWLRLVKT